MEIKAIRNSVIFALVFLIAGCSNSKKAFQQNEKFSGLIDFCSNDSSFICATVKSAEKNREEAIDYKRKKTKNRKVLISSQRKILFSIKDKSKELHNVFFKNSVYSPSLSKKWTSIVNIVVKNSSNKNIYTVSLENKKSIYDFNKYLLKNMVIVKKSGGFFTVKIKNNKNVPLENKINKILSNSNIFPVIFDLARFDSIYSKSIILDKNDVLITAPVRAEEYAKLKKKVYIFSGKEKAPITIGLFGNLYIHENHIKEFNKLNILKEIMYHEAIHVKYKILKLDTVKNNNKISDFGKRDILSYLGKNDKNREVFENGIPILNSVNVLTTENINNNMKNEHINKILSAKGINNFDIDDLMFIRKFRTSVTEIFVDMEASEYLKPSEMKRYIKAMSTVVSFDNRYKLFKRQFRKEKTAMEVMQEHYLEKTYLNYNDLLKDEAIRNDLYFKYLEGIF